MLNELQKRVCQTVGPSHAAFLEPLAYRRIVARCLFCRYYFGRRSSEVMDLVPRPHSLCRSTRYSNRLHDFLSPFLDVNSFFPRTAGLWNSLPTESLRLTHDPNDFKS